MLRFGFLRVSARLHAKGGLLLLIESIEVDELRPQKDLSVHFGEENIIYLR